MFAIIRTNGHQYIIEKGGKIEVDNLGKKEGEKVVFDEVLLAEKDGKITIGKPVIKDASVEAKVLRNFKGEKTTVFKMKPKKRYSKTFGFRPSLTEIEISNIKI